MAEAWDSLRSGGTIRGPLKLYPRTTGEVPLVITGIAGQTANLFEVRNSSDTLLFAVSATGVLTITGTPVSVVNEDVSGNLTVAGTSTLIGAVSTGSTLSVTGNSTFGTATTGDGTFFHNLSVNGAFNVLGSTVLSGTLILGTQLLLPSGTAATPSLSFSDDQDIGLYRQGKNSLGFSVAGVRVASFSSTTLTMFDHILMRSDQNITFGTSNNSLIAWNTAQTVDALFIGTATAQNTVVMAEIVDYTFDFAHAAQTNPTLFIHSANQSTSQWISFAHNGTNGVIDVGTGVISMIDTLSISPASDISALILQEFDTTPAQPILSIKNSAGTAQLTFNTSILYNTTAGITFDFTTTGSDAIRRVGLELTLDAGFTGNEFTTALSFDNTVAGVNTDYTLDVSTYGYRPSGNRGIGGFSRAVTVGHNTGGMMGAGGGAYNYGVWAFATVNKASAVNIGVFGTGQNQSGGAGASRIGGYFTILNQATAPPVTGINAALVADNGSSGADVFLARNNGVTVLNITDGSIMTYTTLVSPSNLTVSTESTKVNWVMTGLQTWAGAGTVGTQREIRFQAPTYAGVGATTFSNVMTFQIDACPTASTNVTFTKVYAAQFGGDATIGPTSAGLIYGAISVPAHTITVSGSTQVTSVGPCALRLNIVTMTDSSAVTIDSGSTLYIAGAVAQAGSVTITNKYAIWSDDGDNRFDGNFLASSKIVEDGTTTTSGAGAVAITGRIHEITTTGIGNAMTLANGTEGQRLTIVYVAEGAGTDTAILTPTSMGNGTVVTFNVVGDIANAVFTNGKWYFWSQGAVIT